MSTWSQIHLQVLCKAWAQAVQIWIRFCMPVCCTITTMLAFLFSAICSFSFSSSGLYQTRLQEWPTSHHSHRTSLLPQGDIFKRLPNVSWCLHQATCAMSTLKLAAAAVSSGDGNPFQVSPTSWANISVPDAVPGSQKDGVSGSGCHYNNENRYLLLCMMS